MAETDVVRVAGVSCLPGVRSAELRDSVGEIWALLARYRTLQEIVVVLVIYSRGTVGV